MMRRASTAAILGGAITAICLCGCRPQPVAPAPNAAPPTEPGAPAEPAEPQAATPTEPAQPQAAPPNELAKPQMSAVNSNQSMALQDSDVPQRRTAFYRAYANQPATIPPVLLSKGHDALCRVKVGDTMPEIELEQLGGGRRKLMDLSGKTATVVVFWKSDRHMARQELADLGPDVLQPYGESGVAVVGIAVNEPMERVPELLQRTGANFPNLLDANGEAFAKVGSEKLPRTFLVDPNGKILWFDLEYSLATRRELHQALRAITGEQ